MQIVNERDIAMVKTGHGTAKYLVGDPTLEEANVIIRYWGPQTNLPVHSHPFDEMWYVLDGEVNFGDQTCVAGTCIFIPADAAYGPITAPNGVTLLRYASSGEGAQVDWERIRQRRAVGGSTATVQFVNERDIGVVKTGHGTAKYLVGDPRQRGPNVIIRYWGPQANLPVHSHPFTEMWYVLEGEVNFGNSVCSLGTCIFIPADDVYGPITAPKGVILLRYAADGEGAGARGQLGLKQGAGSR